jgi:hypothetical protein
MASLEVGELLRKSHTGGLILWPFFHKLLKIIRKTEN